MECMRRLLPLFLLTTACSDLPTEPGSPEASDGNTLPLVAAQTLPVTLTCNRSWASGVSGDWDDPSMWTPYGVPDYNDDACLDASGTYTVTMGAATTVWGLQIGGPGASVTVETEYDLLISGSDGLLVKNGSRLTLSSSGDLYFGKDPSNSWTPALENEGVIEIIDDCTCGTVANIEFESFLNEGFLFVAGPTNIDIHTFGSFVNEGFLLTTGTEPIRIGPESGSGLSQVEFQQVSGTIGGDAPVLMLVDFVWSGGTLALLGSDASQAVLKVGEFPTSFPDVTFSNTDLHGRIDMLTRHIYGNVGANVHARAFAGGQGSVGLYALPGAPTHVFENQGRLELDVADIGADLRWNRTLVNSGTIEFIGTHEVKMSPETLVNRGSIILEGTLDLDGRYGSTAGLIRNEGAIAVETSGLLRITKADFVSTTGAMMTGPLELHTGATLSGVGTVGSVRSFASTIGSPGVDGRLAFGSLVLDAASRVILAVHGTEPGDYDVLALLGVSSLGGTLDIRTAPSFQGGRCGQVVPVITQGFGLARSTFGTTRGLVQGPLAAWRLHDFAGGISLAGYRPGKGPVTATPTGLILTEGGAGGEYNVCLGETAPSAEVVVTPLDAAGQLALAGARVFRTTDWMLPRTLTVSAIDDVLVEGPHSASVVHTVSSADPFYSGTGPFGRLSVSVVDNDGEADLVFTKVSQEDNRYVGDLMNTTFRVENLGPTESSGSTVKTTALVGLDYDSAAGADCSVDVAGVITCLVDPIAAGAQADFTLTFLGAVVGLHTQTLTVVGEQPDPDSANDVVVYTQRVN